MGMTIDDFYWSKKYQQLQADYEARLKADMVAMLTDIQLEIEELEVPKDANIFNMGYWTGITDSKEAIQEKINKLKETD